jgi:membrane fusion protein (multidrug efflux system)
MNMADENPPRSVSDAGKETPVEASPVTDTVYSSPSYGRSKRRRNILIVVVVLVVLVGGLFLWRYLSSYESTDDAQADVHLYPVSARISGHVIRVNVDDNQWVQQGTVLVEIDPKDYEVAVAQAKANLASAEATAQSLNITVPITSVSTLSQLTSTSSDIENATAGVAAAEKQLLAAHAQLEQAQANDVRAQDDLHRYKLLVDKREVAAICATGAEPFGTGGGEPHIGGDWTTTGIVHTGSRACGHRGCGATTRSARASRAEPRIHQSCCSGHR